MGRLTGELQMNKVSADPPVLDEQPEVSHERDLYGNRISTKYTANFSSFGDDDIDAFFEHGYIAFECAFSPDQVRDARSAIDDLIAGGNKDFRGVQYEESIEGKDDRPVRKLMSFVEYDARLATLANHADLHAFMRRLLGDTPELFQDMALLKNPGGREKPWHQDSAYFNLSMDTTVIGVWIALDQATLDNGCLHILPGTHRMGPTEHFKVRDWQICDSAVQRQLDIAVPLPPGGCLIWHGLLHHGSPTNHSSKSRRALQFHYRPVSSNPISTEERMQHFGGAVRGAEC